MKKGECKKEDCKYVHSAKYKNAANKPCPLIEATGKCKFGERCHFSHDTEAVKTAKASWSKSNAASRGRSATRKPGGRKAMPTVIVDELDYGHE